MSRSRNAPIFKSLREILRTVEASIQAMMLALEGHRPFAFSYKIRSYNPDVPDSTVTGVVWGKSIADALQHVGVKRDGTVVGYDREVTELPWEN